MNHATAAMIDSLAVNVHSQAYSTTSDKFVYNVRGLSGINCRFSVTLLSNEAESLYAPGGAKYRHSALVLAMPALMSRPDSFLHATPDDCHWIVTIGD